MNRQVAAAQCPTCGHRALADRDEDGFAELDTVPCQGSDTCCRHLCENCRIECDGCGLHACASHVTQIDGETYCWICARELRDGVQLAPQAVCERLSVLAQAGCTLAETRAAMQIGEGVN